MTDYGTVQSAVRPDEKIVDEYSVWVNTDIAETADGWEYHMIQYTKDEYIKLMDEANQIVAMEDYVDYLASIGIEVTA